MKAVVSSRSLLILAMLGLSLAACSPNRELNTGTPKGPDYCPCDIPPAPPPSTQPNLF